MRLVLGFLPFIVFAVCAANGFVLAGLVLGAALACAAMLRARRLRLLEAASAALFGGLAAVTALAPDPPGLHVVRLVVDAGLAAIALLSLAVGRPFTLDYAREEVPERLWTHPVFLATNRRITSVWSLAFVIGALGDAAVIASPTLARPVASPVSIAALVAAVWFTRWYPARVRRRVASAQAGPVL